MKQPWFRFYCEAVNDPKLAKLSHKSFRYWVLLLCVSAEHSGKIPEVSDLTFLLRLSQVEVQSVLAELLSVGLIDQSGQDLTIHNWEGRQYASDVSTERVKRCREKKRNATETFHETFHSGSMKRPQIQIQIQNTDTEIPPNPLLPEGRDNSDVLREIVDRIKNRHPRKEGITLGAQWLLSEASSTPDPVHFLRGVDERHEARCKSSDWRKDGGKYCPQLARWIQDKKHLDPVNSEDDEYEAQIPSRGPVVF